MEKQKSIPQLRFPEFDGGWENKYLKDVLSNKSIKYNPEISNEALKCVELEHLATGTGQLLGYSDSSESGSIKNRFNKGDVLFGKLRPYLRKYLLAPFDGVCSSEIWVINGKNALNEYIYWLIQTEEFIGLANQSSGSKMPRADWDVIASSEFRFPTLLEQQKIASFFIAIDQKISQLKRKKTLLEQYKKGVMQKIFSQEIRFKDDNWRDYPKWENKKLSEYLYVSKDKNFEGKYGKEDVLSVSGDYGIVNQIEFQGRSFAGESVLNYGEVETGDIVYTKSPLKNNPYGIIKVNKGKAGIVSTLYAVYKCKDNALGEYFDYYFQLDEKLNGYLRPLVHKGAKNDMKINNERVLIDTLTVPCRKEQEKIVAFFNAIDIKINHTQKQIEKAEVWKKGLMQQMFV